MIPKHVGMLILSVVKVVLLTACFTILWIYLFYEQPQSLPSDHSPAQREPSGKSRQFQYQSRSNVDKVDTKIEQIATQLLEKEHGSADEKKAGQLLNEICTEYDDICQRLSREGHFTAQESLFYHILTVFLIKHIDSRLSTEPKVRNAFTDILFFKDDSSRRGSAGHSYIKINVEKIASWPEFREVLTHELGHTVDFSVLLGNSSKKDPVYTEFSQEMWSIDDPSIDYYKISRDGENIRKKSSSYKDFISGYAMKGIYEDFAEHKNAWFNHQAIFQELASTNTTLQKKYDYFRRLYNDTYFATDAWNLDLVKEDKRPWDSTKMWTEEK